MKLNFNQQRMAIIIFARLNSRRLPKKVMSKVGSKPLLLFIIDRIKKNSNFRLPIIVATSKNKSDNEIEIFCKKNKIKVFRGELDDVFKRSLDCMKKFKLESVKIKGLSKYILLLVGCLLSVLVSSMIVILLSTYRSQKEGQNDSTPG